MVSMRDRAVQLLLESNKTGKYIDRLLTESLSDNSISDQEKRFLTELVKGTARMQGLLNFYLKELIKGRLKNVKIPIRYILIIGLYQLIYMDSIPAYAAINESVKLAKKFGNERDGRLVNAVLRNFERGRSELQKKIESFPDEKRISIKYSHPEWLIKRWIERFGKTDTEKLCSYNNRVPRLSVRLNNLLKEHPKIRHLMKKEPDKITKSTFLENYYTFEKGYDNSVWEAFDEGEFTIQDVSAGFPVRLLAPEAGETVIDLCAAPGGKTGAIVESMGDAGRVVAVDSNEYRLSLVKQHGERLGLSSIDYIHGDGSVIKLPIADRILVDAPCSGTGVFAKRADIRWQRKETDIEVLANLQLNLLQHASEQLKKGGILVYSTCTMEEEENWGVVDIFLENNLNFKVEDADKFVPKELTDKKGAVATYPFKHYIDGSFCVRMKKS